MLVALLAAIAGCSNSYSGPQCAAYGATHPSVYVIDAVTGQPICTASATIEGGYLTPGPACGYLQVLAADGPHHIAVSAPGYRPSTLDAHLRTDACGQHFDSPGPYYAYAGSATVALMAR